MGGLTAHVGDAVDPPWPSLSVQQNLRKAAEGQVPKACCPSQRLLLEFTSERLTMGTFVSQGHLRSPPPTVQSTEGFDSKGSQQASAAWKMARVQGAQLVCRPRSAVC